MENFMVEYAIPFAYVLLAVAAIGSFLMPVISSLQDPKSLIKPLIGIVGIAIVYAIGYALAGNEMSPVYAQYGVNAEGSKIIGGILTTTYLMGAVAVVGAILGSFIKLFR